MLNSLENIGQRLKECREAKKYSQKAFSEQLGILQQSLSKYENGAQSIPDDIKLKLAIDFQVNIHWLVTGKGSMYQEGRIHDKNLFEIPFLTQEEALKFDPRAEIPEPKANSGEQPDYAFVLAPRRLLEYSTDLRAFEVFGNRMFPVLRHGDIAIIQTTGWNGNGIYLYRMGAGLHISYVSRERGVVGYVLADERKPKDDCDPKTVCDAQDFHPVGRVQAVVKDLFGFDWVGGNPPPKEG
jgi:transcriptional regulator with XRE-family HTH domain